MAHDRPTHDRGAGADGQNGAVASRERMQVEVLGPLRVYRPGGDDITPAGALQRRLLALLVLRRGHAVSADTAIDVLWPASLPRDPAGALQNHLSRLRAGLPPGLIESVGDGYRLDPSAIELDSERLVALLSDGVAADSAGLAEIDAVLGRWQGPAFPELDDLDDGRTEAVRLHELRVRAQEARAEHRLANGETDGLVAELSALADAEPLRERPRSLLMTALAATRRHVEALRVYDDFRRLLGDELGTEPSPELTAQHAALLRGTPESEPAWAPASRLPVPATALIGREHLAAEVAGLVESCRLVSMVGPGGVGKTRLLVEVGHLLRSARPDRSVVLCELSTADESSVPNVVAASVGIDTRPGMPLADQVASVLGDAELVVLVDNCEHVLDPAAGLVDHLLARCPNLRVVTTSRERLRVPGEQVCPVPALPVEGAESPAVRLFVERAGAVMTGFEPRVDELDRIGEIVRRLDGLPLAIELAAARLFTHDLDEVAAGLDHRFALLSSGYRTSSRHASLRAAVSWSFESLDEPLQQMFAALSVFAGSFTPADAAAVCGVDEAAAATTLAQLVERSLAMRTTDRRFVLLETLRAFGAEQLAATGGQERVHDAHARHLVAWVEQADQRMLEPGRNVIADIDAALPELHVALGWLVDHGKAELAGRLVAALLSYGILRLRPDVLGWSERVTAIDPEDRSPVAPVVWVVAAYAAWMRGDLDATGARSERALAVARQGDGDVRPEVFSIRGSYALFDGDLDTAAERYRRAVRAAASDRGWRLFALGSEVLALGYARDHRAAERVEELLAEVGDAETPHAAYAWYCAGEAEMEGDLSVAYTRFTRALELAKLTSAALVTGTAGASKASIDARVGDLGVAARDFRNLIAHWRRAGMWSTQWTMLRSIAILLDRLGRHRDATVLIGAINATGAGHRIFGSDEVALHELDVRLRQALGDAAYNAARAEGEALDGDAAVEHALRSL